MPVGQGAEDFRLSPGRLCFEGAPGGDKMLKVASWVPRIALILAAMVALAAAGIVASIYIPDTGRNDSCELKTPYLVASTSVAGQRIDVAVDPAGCALDLPEGQLIHVEYMVTDAPVPQEGERTVQMAADGSMHAVLLVDQRNTKGQLLVKIHGDVPGCDEDDAACAAWMHELRANIADYR